MGVRSFTQEFRLVSPESQKVTWLVGAFYSNLINNIEQHLDPTYAPQLATFDLYTNLNGPRRQQIAGFGEVGYSILDNLKATVGIRYSQYDTTNTSFGDGFLNGGQTLVQASANGNATTKKFLLDYQATADNMIYAQASSGFRPGGSIDPVPTTCTAELESLGYPANLSQSNPDSLWNYEVGSKNKFLGGRFIANAAVFYINWSNIQLNRTLNCGFAFTANVGHATSKGFELEAEAEPLPGLTLSGSVSYADAKLTVAAPGIGAAAGDKIPYVPNLTYNLIAEYSHPVGSNATAYIRADYAHIADQITNFSLVSSAVVLPAYGTAGLRIGYKPGPWDFALVATNLTDERALTYYNSSPYKGYVVNRPRTIGVNVRRRF